MTQACCFIPSKKKRHFNHTGKKKPKLDSHILGVRHNPIFSVQKIGSPPAPNQKCRWNFLQANIPMIITSDQLLLTPTQCLQSGSVILWNHPTLKHMTLIIILRKFGRRKEQNLSCLESSDEICSKSRLCVPLTEERRNDGIVGSPCVSPGGAGAGYVGPTVISQLGHLFELAHQYYYRREGLLVVKIWLPYV
jgi:hypothetical protein